MKYLVLSLAALAGAASLPAQAPVIFVGRLLQADRTPPSPVAKVAVRVVSTNQATVTDANGRFQFTLPATFTPGTELQVDIQHPTLRVYQPLGGLLLIPRTGGRAVELQLLPKSSRQFFGPATIEALLTQAIANRDDVKTQAASPVDEPKLRRFLRQWAADYGFGLEAVEAEVKRWAEEVRAKRGQYSERQQALAEYQAKNFAEAQRLFEGSAAREVEEIDRLAAEEKKAADQRREALGRFAKDKQSAADAALAGGRREEAVAILETALRRVTEENHAEGWLRLSIDLGWSLVSFPPQLPAEQKIAACQRAVGIFQALHKAKVTQEKRSHRGMVAASLSVAYWRHALQPGVAESVAELRQALAAANAALVEFPKETDLGGWKWGITAKANALFHLGHRLPGPEGIAMLGEAAAIYEGSAAELIETREWARAATDWDLVATAHRLAAPKVEGPERAKLLDQALTALRTAVDLANRGGAAKAAASYLRESIDISWELLVASSGDGRRAVAQRLIETAGPVLADKSAALAPDDAFAIRVKVGTAYRQLAEFEKGEEKLTLLRAAAQALAEALTTDAKALGATNFHSQWFGQLGDTYQSIFSVVSGPEEEASARAALAAYRSSCQYAFAGNHTDDQPGCLEGRAKMATFLKLHDEVIEAGEKLLSLDPKHAYALMVVAGTYHEYRFDHARAHELNAKRAETEDGQYDFTETQFATARFSECAARSARQLAALPEARKPMAPLLATFHFACQAAGEGLSSAGAAGKQLLQQLPEKSLGWSFRGTLHFVETHAAFSERRAEWLKLFSGLDKGDAASMQAALAGLGIRP